MMPDRFTNRNANWRGNTIVKSVRVPEPIVEVIDQAIATGEFANCGEVLQHAVATWAINYQDEHPDA